MDLKFALGGRGLASPLRELGGQCAPQVPVPKHTRPQAGAGETAGLTGHLSSQTFPGKEGGDGSPSIQGPKPDPAGCSLQAVCWPLFYHRLCWRDGTPLL